MTECKQSLTEVERRAVREALTEERSRFCQFYDLLEPVVLQEMAVLGELSHLQDATEQLRRLTANPRDLPASSEQVYNLNFYIMSGFTKRKISRFFFEI